MCPTCDQFPATVITSAEQLQHLHNRLYFSGVKPGILQVKSGDLQWSDFIDCLLECSSCGQLFKFTCETFHGVGGTFGHVNAGL